jgi:hypothetical protein
VAAEHQAEVADFSAFLRYVTQQVQQQIGFAALFAPLFADLDAPLLADLLEPGLEGNHGCVLLGIVTLVLFALGVA